MGVPISAQAPGPSKTRWRGRVRAAAAERWPEGEDPLEDEVQLRITYFHENAPLDVDNMIKPIQDALNGLAYVDDRQVVRVISGKSDLNGAYVVRGLSEAL